MKPQSFLAIADWLRGVGAPCVLGLDANSPKTDHPIHSQNEWWYEEESELLGENSAHRLHDALRLKLSRDARAMKKIMRQHPSGPLATSYVRGNGRVWRDSRYDFVLVSPELKVPDVRYLMKEARAAGSDHALVVAVLEIDA
jgi:hypothetical protein